MQLFYAKQIITATRSYDFTYLSLLKIQQAGLLSNSFDAYRGKQVKRSKSCTNSVPLRVLYRLQVSGDGS